MPTAVALLPSRCCHYVAVLVAATLIVIDATTITAVAAASWTPWLKSTLVLATGARLGCSKINSSGCGCSCSGDNGDNDDNDLAAARAKAMVMATSAAS